MDPEIAEIYFQSKAVSGKSIDSITISFNNSSFFHA